MENPFVEDTDDEAMTTVGEGREDWLQEDGVVESELGGSDLPVK